MRTKNVQSELDLSDVWAVDSSLVRRQNQFLQEGDILVSSANSWNLVGKCCWIPQLSEKSSFGGFVSVIRAQTSRVNPRYLYRWFSSPRVQTTVRSFGRQTTNISNLNVERCLKLPLPLPSLQEQRRIAEVLDRADELRTKRRGALARLDNLTQSVFLDMFGEPFTNERQWFASSVGDAGKVQLGRQRAPQYQTGKFTSPYLRVANVHEDRIDLSDVLEMDFNEEDFDRYQLHEGDILLNEGQSTELVGRPAMWRGEGAGYCYQNTLVRFQSKRSIVNPTYALAVFLRYFRTGQLAKISSKTSNVAHLGAGRFAKMPFPIPPINLQEKFAEQAEEIRNLKSRQQASDAELGTLFASLQDRAFRGAL
ncbi:restriction endonuclease subunit S [Micromonospora sonchi]|nr:restriction endonuclease subunit S [Micromonospora sonchi]